MTKTHLVFRNVSKYSELFVDELGTVWKYTEPGSMPRERHDKLYAASSNDRDGEPSLPMSDAFDYQIIYEGQEA